MDVVIHVSCFGTKWSKSMPFFGPKLFKSPYPQGDSYKNGWGYSWEILKRTRQRDQDPALWAWLEMLFALSPFTPKGSPFDE